MGKLIIIEGLDGSGKSTQAELLSGKIEDARFIAFPDYESLSGKIIKEYLNGLYTGLNEPDSAFAASSFYAVDRYISYKTDWAKDYLTGKNIISARYTCSNLIYQMAKLPREKWDEYHGWLHDFEHVKLGLPASDTVIFLDMPLEISQELLTKRYERGQGGKDLHEADMDFLKKCKQASEYAAEKDNWIVINCARGNKPREIEEINEELLKTVKNII